jgi:BirA family transcriptional regulator, biotin operon repressor / biotin---[acetyl-CoA-carboxylase] ligase
MKFNQASLILHLSITDSTMLEASRLLESIHPAPDNVLVIADEQHSGMGRNNNLWQSPFGGLWFTYCFKAEQPSNQVALLVGLCLRDTLLELYPDFEDRLKLKWPNDLLLDGKKLAGILVKAGSGFLSIGIGLNTNIDSFNHIEGMYPVSLQQILKFPTSHRALLQCFLIRFTDFNQKFTVTGFIPYRNSLNLCLAGMDKPVTFDTGQTALTGICRGITEEGSLLIETSKGKITEHYFGSLISIGL